jgi:hypothetical protein
MSFYLESCVNLAWYDFVIYSTKERRVYIKFCTTMLQPSFQANHWCREAGYAVITLRQSNNPPNGKVHTHRDWKSREVKSKVKTMLMFFFGFKEIVHKKFILVGQTINSAFYCDILWQMRENVRRLRPELWQQKDCLFHQDFFFLPKPTLLPWLDPLRLFCFSDWR